MGLYARYLLPRLTDCACASPALARLRGLIVPRAQGTVLEVGFGSGLNLRWYDPGRVRRLVALEPSPELCALARARLDRCRFPVDVVEGAAEAIPLPDASVDSVVVTFTLCTVHDPARAAAEMRRVLRPGGCIHFAEHGAAASEQARRWQRRLEPLWVPLAGGCHLTRHPARLLQAPGLRVDWEEGLLGEAGPAWRAIDRLFHGYWGSAQLLPSTNG